MEKLALCSFAVRWTLVGREEEYFHTTVAPAHRRKGGGGDR